jgi:hypothetical protein
VKEKASTVLVAILIAVWGLSALMGIFYVLSLTVSTLSTILN